MEEGRRERAREEKNAGTNPSFATNPEIRSVWDLSHLPLPTWTTERREGDKYNRGMARTGPAMRALILLGVLVANGSCNRFQEALVMNCEHTVSGFAHACSLARLFQSGA